MAERILITGARAPAALDLARSFAAAGFEAHLADASPCLMARLSTAPAAVHTYASPRRAPRDFGDDLARLIKALDPRLIVPACEEVFHLAALAENQGWAGRLFAPPPALLDRLHAKSRFAALAGELGLPAPQTHRLLDRADLAAYAATPQDWVFKPDYSRFGAQAMVGPGPQALARLTPSPDAPLVVQRRVRGEEVSFYACALNGRLVAFCAYGSSWRLAGGVAYVFEAVAAALAAQLHGMAERLAGVVITGQFACDALLDGEGRPHLIECNPRATSGVHLFSPGPDLALAMLGGAPAVPDGRSRRLEPAFWRYGLVQAAATGGWARWRDQHREGRDVISTPGDRAPVLGAVADSLLFSAAAALGGRSLAAQMTADIEWNGEALK